MNVRCLPIIAFALEGQQNLLLKVKKCVCVTFGADWRPEAGKYMVGSGKFVSTRTESPASFLVANRNSQNNHRLKKFVYYRKRQCFLIEIDEKKHETELTLFDASS